MGYRLMGIFFTDRGSFNNTRRLLKKAENQEKIHYILDYYGALGCQLLSEATPMRTGLTASSWSYQIEHDRKGNTLIFNNSHENKGVNIAIILQYGHGTINGGYVKGLDYINPVGRVLMEQIRDRIWAEVLTI